MSVFLRIVFLFLILSIVFVTARFSMLQFTIKLHKKSFRYSTLIHNKKQLKVISIPSQSIFADSDGIEWKENNKEIVINGKYHEVVEIKKNQNSFQVFVIEDDEENLMFYKYFISEKLNKQLVNCFLLIYSLNAIENNLILILKNHFKDIQTSFNYIFKFGFEFENLLIKPPCCSF